MSDFDQLPLENLLHYCPPLLEIVTATQQQAWRVLLRRALAKHNDGAWDALVARLWSAVLYWIYAKYPDVTPIEAERLTHHTLWHFRQTYLHSTASHTLPANHSELSLALQQCLFRVLHQRR